MDQGFAFILRSLAAVLLIIHMGLGIFVWTEDHDDQRLRVIRLGFVIVFALILLCIIGVTGRYLP